ncbi:MAG TPA: ATP-binding protein, partial [Thermotogota bacterium]|nr:ATP-binding protein [Thermotogota bacterium]
GVFCLGHTETPRKWHTGEEAFATTIAAIVAQLFENAERRRVAEVLRQNEANLTAILENDAVSIWALDKEYRVIYTNPVFYQGFFDAYGVRLNKGVPYLEALPPVKRALWKENFDAVLNRRSVQFFDTVAIGQESIYIDVAMNPVLFENEVKGISVFSKNITEQILAEKALQESQKRYHDILEVAPVGIMVYQNEKVRYINPSGLALLGADRVETVLDKNVRSIIHPDDADSCLNTIRDILSGVAAIPAIEARILRFDGTQRFTELTFSSLQYDGALAVQVIARDITERREAEEDRIARKVAEEANRAKSVFLSNMSHEIRTPLNAIIGFAQILKRDSSLSPKQVEQLQTIARSGEHLLKLINDILDLSKIEAGKLQIHPSPFDLHKLIADIENMFRFRAEEKGLQFIVELKESVPQYVRSDEGKLRQILINLLGNSVKFTKIGGIVLRLKAGSPGKEETLQKELCLFIEVEDTGPGIPEDEISQIFDSFRVSSAGRAAGGTGLGLAITKNLLELMGGGISVSSQVSRGSIFRFELPIVRLENLEVEENRAKRTIVGLEPRSGPYRILIVDDQKDNRELLRDLLEPIGFRVRTAQNGQEGLYLFERWFPNLILMDMRMPILDGYEATRKIKATERGRKTPVIAVTASAFEDEEKSVSATGVDGYLRKPVCPDDLFELIEKLLKARFLYKDPETAPSDSERAPLIQQEDLASIPDSVRLEMRKALEEGEMLKLKGLIDRIKESDPRIAQGLLFLVKRYDYEQLGKLL